MAIMKLLDLAREILQAMIDTKDEWLCSDVINDDGSVGETLESVLQAEVDGYQGDGFLCNWILFTSDYEIAEGIEVITVAKRFYETVSNLDNDDQEELETMIRDLAVDYLATGKVM